MMQCTSVVSLFHIDFYPLGFFSSHTFDAYTPNIMLNALLI